MIALVTAVFALLFQAVAPSVHVQAGTAVRPETTTVGQHFVATIRVRVPAGAHVLFPAHPDSAAHVDSAGPTTRSDSTASGFTESTVNYVLAAWDTGSQRLGLDSVAVMTPSGERFAKLNAFQIQVRSVLPRDTALRKPKPYRPLVPIAAFNWLPWIAAAIAALACAILFIVWRNWRQRKALGPTPFERAEREFARVDSLQLIAAGDPERYSVEMTRVMRVYLAAVIPPAMQSATTHQLAMSLGHSTTVPVQRLINVLDATDRIKFAQERSTADRARDIGAEARRIVAETHAALIAETAAAAKAA